MKRVMILGQPGAGKSTLARDLAARTGLPVVHMDKIHWQSGWVARPLAHKIEMIRAEQEKDRWIIEGGLSATFESRAARADLMLWIDIGLSLRVWRVLRRTWRSRGRSRPDLPEGCPEKFDAETLDFLRFIWRTRLSARRRIETQYAAFQGQKHRFGSLREIEAWLAAL
ncbi:MAG: hypothetical protein AAF841_03110 [Pseudomonadota bacterium]